MSELERALKRLGDRLVFPQAPDVSERVVAEVAVRPAPGSGPRRRAVAVALIVAAVAVGAAFAVPQARTAILELFRLRGATVQRVDALPRVPRTSELSLDLGEPVPLADGRPEVKIPEILVPEALGPPDAAYTSSEPYGMRLTLVYGPEDGIPRSPYTGVGILVSEFVGEPDDGFVGKLAASGTTVERVDVGSFSGLWLEDGPHAVLIRGGPGVVFEDDGRLAGNTLLVERKDVLVRIEGEIGREQAIRIAESLSP